MPEKNSHFDRSPNISAEYAARESARTSHGRNTAVAPGNSVSAVLLFSVSTLLVIISSFIVVGDISMSRNWPVWIAIVCVFWLSVYVTCSYTYFRSVYLFTSSFILLLFFYHLGVTVPIGFGFYEDRSWGRFSAETWSRSIWNEKAAWYTLIAFGCIGVGFSLSLFRSENKRPVLSEGQNSKDTLSTCRWVGMGLMVVSVMMLAYTISIIGNPLNYSRFDFFSGVGADLRGWGIFLMAFPVSCILLVVGAQSAPERYMVLGFAGVAFIVVLLSGYRGVAMNAALAGAILWVKVGRRIPPLLAIAGLFFVLVAIAAVAELRQVDRYSEINQKKLESAVEGADIGYSLIQMGQSGGVLGHVLRLVPDKYPYRYGTTYLQAIGSSIPNFGLEMALGTRGEVKQQSSFSRSTVASLPPDEWLSYELLGRERFIMGHGVGFSAIGEPYLNFGYPGVVVFFVLLGYLLGRLDRCDLLQHPRTLVFAALMLPSLLLLTRNQFSTLTKPVVFLLIFVLIWHFGTGFLRSRRRHVRGSTS